MDDVLPANQSDSEQRVHDPGQHDYLRDNFGYLYDYDLGDLWGMIGECKEEQTRIRDYLDVLHAVMADKMAQREVTEGGVTYKKRRTTNRTWDHDGLFSAAKKYADDHRIIIDRANGVIEDPVAAYERVLRDWASPPQYWRVGRLTAAGLQLDEYAATSYGPPRVEVIRVSGEGSTPQQ